MVISSWNKQSPWEWNVKYYVHKSRLRLMNTNNWVRTILFLCPLGPSFFMFIAVGTSDIFTMGMKQIMDDGIKIFKRRLFLTCIIFLSVFSFPSFQIYNVTEEINPDNINEFRVAIEVIKERKSVIDSTLRSYCNSQYNKQLTNSYRTMI